MYGLRELWQKAAYNKVCSAHSCSECKRLFNSDECPDRDYVSVDDTIEFIKRVNEIIENRLNSGPLAAITEEELVDIFEMARPVDK